MLRSMLLGVRYFNGATVVDNRRLADLLFALREALDIEVKGRL